MVILSYRIIKEFFEQHTDSTDSLNNWYKITEKANWANFSELKQIFSTCDYVRNGLYVFNIKGNHYRLIARISFRVRTVYIKFIGTHKEYDKVDIDTL